MRATMANLIRFIFAALCIGVFIVQLGIDGAGTLGALFIAAAALGVLWLPFKALWLGFKALERAENGPR